MAQHEKKKKKSVCHAPYLTIHHMIVIYGAHVQNDNV